MTISDSSALFQQPLNFVHGIEAGKHIVLFYEELEYAKIISFQFIKNGLAHQKDCSYVSEEEEEAVKREMLDNGIDVKKFMQNKQLHIYQVTSLTDYNPGDSPGKIKEREEEAEAQDSIYNDAILRNLSKAGQPDRIVLRYIYKVNSEEQIKSNLKWEHDYRFKNLKNIGATVVCVYPVNDIIPTISDSTGPFGKWMHDLLEIYDGVIFARRFLKGVAFRLA
ncbi:MAG: MEDS domain-containing protein [Nitrososphaeraceae archaeon]|nr:MEDS domain-containing protein [Nitrososphaeraceae archaeon]